MAEHNAKYEYVMEQIKASPVIQVAFRCAFRGPNSDDIVIVKRDSITLLSREINGDWIRKSHRILHSPIRHAACLRRIMGEDKIAITTVSGHITFIGYADGNLDVVHELQTSNLHDTLSSTLDRSIRFNANGKYMCILAMENQLAIYKLNDQSSNIAFAARRVFTIDGMLLNCCFLTQNRGTNSLIVHIIRHKSCRLALFNWLEEDLLEAIVPRFMPIDQSMAVCLFMLPLSRKASAAFLHVSAEQIALIHEDNVHCGDLQFSTMELKGITPSAIIELHCKETSYIALMSTSDNHIHVIVLDTHANLSIIDLGTVGFAATSLVFLEENNTNPCSISTFLCGSNGESGFYNMTIGSSPTIMTRFLEAVPAKDFLVGKNSRHNMQSKLSTIGGIGERGTIQSHSVGLAAYAQDEFAILEPQNTAPKQIFALNDRFGHSFVIISLPWSSQLLQLQAEPRLEVLDVGSHYALAEEVPTISIFVLNDCFIQITPKSITHCRAGEAGSVLSSNTENETTVIAESCEGQLAQIMQTESTYVLRMATFVKTEDEHFEHVPQGTDIAFSVEVMSMQFVALDVADNALLLLLCFADGRILLFRSAGGQLVVLVDDNTSLIEAVKCTENDADAIIPHSSIILFEKEDIHVLISLRSGTIAHFRSRKDRIVLEALHQGSQTPITFGRTLNLNHVGYFLGEHLGRVAVVDGELIIDTIGRSGKSPETFACSTDPFFIPGASALTRQFGVLCLSGGILSFNTISNELEDIIEVNNLGETPQRMLQVDELDCLLVATNKRTKSPEGDHGITNMANLQVRRGQACLTTFPLRDSKKQSLIFKPGEKIFALIQWDVTINGKDRSWSVVGSSKRNTKNGKCDEGKLTVLRFKTAGDKVDVRKEFSPSFQNPVYALCAFGSLSLLVAHGNILEVCTLDIENRALASQTQAELRSPAVALHTYDEYVFAATQKDSILVFRYEIGEKKLVRIATDPYPRMSVSMTVLHDQIVILTDKNKQISVHSWDAAIVKLSLLQTISMPSVIVKTKLFTLKLTEKDCTSRLLPDNFIIIALGLDGSLYSIFRAHADVAQRLNKTQQQKRHELWKDHKMSDLMDRLTSEDMKILLSDSGDLTSTDEYRSTLRRAIASRTQRALAW